jgi:hypothetical protein
VTAVTVSGSTFQNIKATGIQVNAENTATITNFTVTGSSVFQDNNVGINLTQSQASNMTFTVSNSNFQRHSNHPINVFSASSSTGGFLNGTISGNTIGTQGMSKSGTAIGSGIRAQINGRCTADITVTNNTVHEIFLGSGIELAGLSSNPQNTARFTVTNNTVTAPSAAMPAATPLAGIFVQASDGKKVCVTISGNTAFDASLFGGLGAYVLFEETTAPTGVMELIGNPVNTSTTQITTTNTGTPVVELDGVVTVVAVCN